MDQEEREIRIRLRDDFRHYASKCLKIRTKFGVDKFIMNRGQLKLDEVAEKQKRETGKVRIIICKGRQMGCSTLIGGRYYWLTTHHEGARAFILTHDGEATNNLFDMTQRYHQNCPKVVRPVADTSNAKELYFGGLDSGYKVGTAGNKGVGRSSTIQYLHGSEVAFWANAAEHAKGIMQAVPNARGTEIWLESTANGMGNYFHQQWQAAESGQSDFIAIFLPWYWQDEYRREAEKDFSLTDEEIELQELYGLDREQLQWRRYKIIELSVSGADGLKGFRQEYPNNSLECFQASGEDTFIQSNLVMRARQNEAEAYGPLVIGCDPARFGQDRTCIIRRQGRKMYGLERYVKKDTMEIVGILHNIIKNEAPTKVFIDIGGLGAGIYDRLVELGYDHIVVAVNSGSTPLDQKLYLNKRSEMWGTFKQWLEDEPCQIPDSDELHADICSTRYKFDSLTRLVMEPKADMKKRGIRSSDCADAACLTLAYPLSALIKNTAENSDKKAKSIMGTYKKAQALKSGMYKR
jgi:hypothetical protein